jgi:hypothetical protein
VTERLPAIQAAVLAHLRAATTPVSSRDLAARFLKIAAGDEETCRRLLAPLLGGLPGVSHDPARGWSSAPAGGAPRPPAPSPRPPLPAPAGPARRAIAPIPGPGISPGTETAAGPPADCVAVATEGGGPGGSGGPRVAALVPVIGGEILPEEIVPAWAGEDPEAIRPAGGAGLQRGDLEAILETIGDLPVVCHRVGREFESLRAACLALGLPIPGPVISMAKIGHLLCGLKRNHAAPDLAAAIGIAGRGPDDCRGRARLVAEAYLALAPRLAAIGCVTIEAIVEYQDLPAAPVDMRRYAFTHDDLRALPAAPGVYRFLDDAGSVLYIGKTRDLRSRVGSYFTPSSGGTARGRAILDQVRRLEVTLVASDLEAALLEAALIQEHRPPLNRQFEVHERPAPYGPRLDLAVVLPDRTATGSSAGCTIHLLRQGRYLGRVPGSGAAAGALRSRLADAYFHAGPEGRAGDRPIDIDWPIVSSYLRAHRDEVSVLDFDECADADEAAVRIEALVRATAMEPGRVIARDRGRPARPRPPVVS